MHVNCYILTLPTLPFEPSKTGNSLPNTLKLVLTNILRNFYYAKQNIRLFQATLRRKITARHLPDNVFCIHTTFYNFKMITPLSPKLTTNNSEEQCNGTYKGYQRADNVGWVRQ